MFNWFDARETGKFGMALAEYFMQKAPVETIDNLDKKSHFPDGLQPDDSTLPYLIRSRLKLCVSVWLNSTLRDFSFIRYLTLI